MSSGDVWKRQAAQWERVGAPLRPGPQDVRWHEHHACELRPAGRPLRVLQLGVTPEIAAASWPEGTRLLAVDRCADMIARVWPGPREAVVQAEWLAMPVRPASFDLVSSDGCFGVIAHPRDHRMLLETVASVLRGAGRFVFRVFVRPERSEAPAAVYADALSGRIASFHAFKLRLLMAMQPHSDAGVCTGEVWSEFTSHAPPREHLAAAAGWPIELIATIDAYRGQPTRYCFPTLEELRTLLRDSELEELSCIVPDYELGARCPTLVLQRR